MFYVPTEYSNYKYLVNVSDNYVLLSRISHVSGSWDDPDTVPVIYQYFTPSITTIEDTYTTYNSTTFTNVSSQISDSIFDRADFPQIFVCNFFILLIFAFVLNQLSKLVKKGRCFWFLLNIERFDAPSRSDTHIIALAILNFFKRYIFFVVIYFENLFLTVL